MLLKDRGTGIIICFPTGGPQKHPASLYLTRGPWTAMLALLKVEETGQNHKHFQTCKKILNCCNIPGNGIIC